MKCLSVTGAFLSQLTSSSLKQILPNLKAGQRQIILDFIQENTPIAHLKIVDYEIYTQKTREIKELRRKLEEEEAKNKSLKREMNDL